MSETSWLKEKNAMQMAHVCIEIVKQELDVKLTLSHPLFIDLLKQYVELTDSEHLSDAYHDLISFAGTRAPNFRANANGRTLIAAKAPITKAKPMRVGDIEYLLYKGKPYKRFENGLEFQGLYRGQPYYA
ncbi:Uncharacterised protein [BD1-7 clade bacterium]|uniref:Uncharacterized protein n=1 Tax=BD1-7 clade bacterium TaxID=2029982 RepID=A0A5S9NZD8_9GAMM|nr:Uncharacterised protein [BD1-7 clade bacterium]